MAELPLHLQKPEPSPTVIGSLAEGFKYVGRLSVVPSSLSPYKESDIDGAAEGSVLKFDLDKGTLPLMIRARLAQASSSATFKIRCAKAEAVGDTSPEKFYDEIAEVTFTTSAGAISADRGGFFADEFAIVSDDTLKGIAVVNKHAKCTYVDVLGFSSIALEAVSFTGPLSRADIDVTNS